VYLIDKYSFNTIELHHKKLNLINWQIILKGKKPNNNNQNCYNAELEIEVTTKEKQSFFNIKSGLFFLLSLDPNLEIINHDAKNPHDIYS